MAEQHFSIALGWNSRPQYPEQSAAASVPGNGLHPPLALAIWKNVLRAFWEATGVHASDLLLSHCLTEQKPILLFASLCY